MDFYRSIWLSLFSVDFYREITRAPLARGLMYLLRWTFLACILTAFFLSFRAYPEVRGFMDWVEETVPPVQWTPEGLKMSQKSPYIMKHPKYGHFATFDMNAQEVTDATMGDATIYVTSSKLYIKESRQRGTRVYNLTAPPDAKTKRNNITLDGNMIRGLEKNLKPVFMAAALILTFLVFFVWKLLAALFYSLVGMLINLFRREKLSYEAILNIALFAMTASTCLQLILAGLGDVIRLHFGFWGSFVVTATYLYLGIKFTEEPLAPAEEIQTFN